MRTTMFQYGAEMAEGDETDELAEQLFGWTRSGGQVMPEDADTTAPVGEQEPEAEMVTQEYQGPVSPCREYHRRCCDGPCALGCRGTYSECGQCSAGGRYGE